MLHRDGWLSTLVDDLEWNVLDVLLELSLVHLTTDESLGVEDSIGGVGVVGGLSGVTDSEKNKA